MGDLKRFQARYLALRQQMFADGISLGLPLHANDFQILTERLESEGTSFVKVTLPLLGKALDQGLVSGHFACIAHFRLKRNTRLPIFAYAIFSRIFTDEGDLQKNPCVKSIRFLRQFLLLDSKLQYAPPSKMQERTVDEFASRMSALRKVRIPLDHPVLQGARKLLGRVLRDLDLTDITPGHGPGAVAEKIDRFARWDFTSWPKKAEREYPYIAYGTHSIRALLERGKGIPLSKESVTRCCLVPKDFKGPRLISAESTVTQYLQQGQMKKIMSYVSTHPLLSMSIRLQDQTYNQLQAQRAYRDGLVTLDLSNASDTVSTCLVWYLLSDVPKLRRQLMATRSDYLIWKDRKIKITAFSPMGSAVCFPVETLVFWAISLSSCQQASLHPRSNKCTRSSSEISRDMAVFGDDIIIPDYALSTLLGTLLSIGCQPNMSKTCWKTPFRESCGSEWYDGQDVTIIRNKLFDYESLNVGEHPVLCDLQRKFFVGCYYRTSELLREWAFSIWPVPVISMKHFLRSPYISRRHLVEDVSALGYFAINRLCLDRFHGCIGFYDDVTSSRLRYNVKWHRYEFRLPVVYQSSRKWESGGYPRLLARLLLDSSERIAIRDRKIKMAWSYLPFLIPSQESRG